MGNYNHSNMSFKDKISVFSKLQENEEECMKLQRKKAYFNSKRSKFESKEPLAKQKVKMFEDFEGMAVREKEAAVRREDFEMKKEIFKYNSEEEVDMVDGGEVTFLAGDVKKKKSLFEQQESVEEDEKEALEKLKRREDFVEKQTLFGQ